jgi:hypothetical protein
MDPTDDDKGESTDDKPAEGEAPKKRKLALTKRVLKQFGVRSGVKGGDGVEPVCSNTSYRPGAYFA